MPAPRQQFGTVDLCKLGGARPLRRMFNASSCVLVELYRAGRTCQHGRLIRLAAAPEKDGSSMRAVVYDRYGPPAVLRLEDVARPVPKADEVLIKIHATTVTRADCATREANRRSGSTARTGWPSPAAHPRSRAVPAGQGPPAGRGGSRRARPP